ncbi:hypothetical protein MNBD_NITROSPIRAE01-476 [hydrothermal vent metagenome]|uniref:DUF1330 domain-containing protein n=1 Tax=hydrothermal vent metagenome TaxID=652676 RepID=A0A3B1CUX6_9ZZZZ
MSFHKITIFLLLVGLAFYPYSSARGENKDMIKLVFVLKVTDEKKYREYRNKIEPLMQQLNIVVLKEYRISKVLHSANEKEAVNLLAIFGFPNQESKARFFSNPVYLEAKQLFAESTTHFEKLIE